MGAKTAPRRFVTAAEARAILGVDHHGLRRRVDRGLLSVFTAGDDLRVRLFDQDELEALLTPTPLVRRREEVPVPA